MKNDLWVAGILVISILLAGCSTVPDRDIARTGYVPGAGSHTDTYAGSTADLSDPESVKDALYAQYDEWRGTRYRIGGLSKDGIDCSGFIHMTFKSRLSITLPRSSDQQAELGTDVDKDQLQAGDLVFFKTGRTLRHVGVYLEDGRFLHASTKLGVVISRLNESYWKSAFWKAKRLDI
jgi:cell wall-associated NlpC family hydrolase